MAKAYTIKLFRNQVPAASYEAALEALNNQFASSAVDDGELISARYLKNGEVKTVLGMVAKVNGKSNMTILDETVINDLKVALENLEGSAVTSVTKNGDTFTIVDADAEAGKTSVDIKLNYASQMPDELTVPTAVGGLQAGVSASTLKSKTYGEILDEILFPELQPTVTNPSASIVFKGSTFANNKVMEVGATAPAASDFTTSFNQGTSKVAGKPDMTRAGALDAANSFIYYGGNTATQTLPAKVVLNQMTYQYHAAYAQGPVLVTSKGNKASLTPNPLAAGSVNSGAVSLFGTYPYFCNGASASTSAKESSLPTAVAADTKLPLVKWDTTLIGAKFASEAATGTRLVFDLPALKKVNKVEMMNPVSGQWEPFTGYTVSNTSAKTVQGVSVNYKRLTTNGAMAGEMQLRFTVANA